MHVMTKPVTFPAADNGLYFLALSVNLSNKTRGARPRVKLDILHRLLSRTDCRQVDWNPWPQSD